MLYRSTVLMPLLKLLLVLIVCAAGPVVAGPLEDGLAAAQKGGAAHVRTDHHGPQGLCLDQLR